MISAEKSTLTRHWAFWSALAVGIATRTVGLRDQLLVGDEMHAYRFVRDHTLWESLATYSNTANSPPINAWLRLFVDLGWPPGEWALRLPVLLTGVALLFWAPRWIAARLDTATGIAAAWLLATAPLLVFYSRFMRPYMPYAFLAAVAAAAFWEWSRHHRLRDGMIYALSGAAAVYLHLLAAPFVVAPFVYLAIEAAVRGLGALPPWRQVFKVGAAFGALVLLFVAPGWPSIERLILIRRQPITLELQDFVGAVARLSGPYTGAGTVIVLALAVYGAWRLRRRDPALVRFGLCLLLVPYSLLPLLSPRYIANGIIYSRYLLPLTVPLLAAAAVGLASSPWPRYHRIWRWLAVAIVALVVGNGPLTDLDLYFNPAGVSPAVLVGRHKQPLPREEVPEFYHRLADGPSGGLIEAPVRPASVFLSRLAEYHRVHGRAIRLAGDEELADPRLGLHSVVSLEPAAIVASGAAYVVIHRDWTAELGRRHGLSASAPESLRRLIRRQARGFERDARVFVRRARRSWGAPDMIDETLAVWDLGRVRASASR